MINYPPMKVHGKLTSEADRMRVDTDLSGIRIPGKK